MSLPVRPFRFQPCPACCHVCQACLAGDAPDELTVTFADLINAGGCADCVNGNGTWVLAKQGDCLPVQWFNGVWVSYQNYQGSFPDVHMCQCAFQQAMLVISLQVAWNYGGVAGQRAVLITIGNSLGCLAVSFLRLEQNQTEPFDCEGFSSLSVPYSNSGLYCSSPGATCQLSS
jgi:hypothetical protein